MSTAKHLYFAYGSNLDWTQMHGRCPGAVKMSVAVLPKHRLAFTHLSRGRDCGVADVIEDSDAEVWGVVYEITDADRESLDKSEGYKRTSDSGAYLWRPKRVLIADWAEQALDVFAYVVARPQLSGYLPSRAYVGQIIAGARHWQLPAAYLITLSKIATKD